MWVRAPDRAHATAIAKRAVRFALTGRNTKRTVRRMTTVESIFQAFGGPAAVAKAIGVTTEHAASMRRRRSIPVRYWPALLEKSGLHDPMLLTNQDLIDAHAKPLQHLAAPEARP